MMGKNDIDKENWYKVKTVMIKDVSQLTLSERISSSISNDIKCLGFLLSRYKFAAKMLKYKPNVSLLELGCNDAGGGICLNRILT
jgi:lysophospholipase L1-like esterase